MSRINRVCGLAAASMIAAASVSFVGVGTANAAVGGTVKCSSGKAVVGVWIDAKDSRKSGWAWSQNNGRSVQSWSRGQLSSGDQYKVRVGCGGTSNKWGVSVHSKVFRTGNQSFTCLDDRPAWGTRVCY